MIDSLHIETPALTAPQQVAPPPVEHLVMEPADSTLQAHFAGQPAMLRQFVVEREPVENWGFPLPLDSVFLAEQRCLWDSLSREITWQHESVPYRPDGIAGDPIPYRFRNDDFVTSALMLSFFLLVWVMASSWRFLREMAKDFFHNRTRPNLFTDRANTVLRGRFFLIAQACFMQGILFFDYTQKLQPEVFAQVSPYTLLGSATLIFGIYYLSKILLYRIVNHTFFPTERNKQWDNQLLVSILTTGSLLLPLTLLVVYFDLPFRETLITYILLMVIVKILLFYKAYRIFFSTLIGHIHIILYFCALEAVPILTLWTVLLTSNRFLMANA